ncbi:UBP1-associated protein 2C [Heracleum sosnowskyi]|uniref:UBP1-associated protein 2C n=1 Tax=Heracleum sosnowskyi TaxID=360622 RepID=A0AAD8IPH6_9APIA|nr:UBP1-associated protein 2C [Heracleum sosnowskyi]
MDLTKKRKLEDNGLLQPIFDLSIADVRKIISSFTNDQLLDIVQNAAVRHLDVLDAVRSIADQDLSQRKLFIRGLGWDTTNENLAAIFSAYGELDEAVVILDKATGKSKGFGFLTYKHIDGAIRALKEPSKKIDGRMTVTNLASAGPGGGPVMQQPVDVSNRKIYVANVPYEMPADRLLGFFLSYGEIEEGPLGFDKLTGKSKGFALFVYKSEEGAKAALVDPVKNIDGVQLNCKLANDGKKGKGGGGEVHGNGVGVGVQQVGVVQGSGAVGQYGGAGGVTGYGGVAYAGGLQGPLTQGQHPQNPSFGGGIGVGGPGYSSLPSQVPTSMGYNGGYGAVSGAGAPYSSSQYGGPGATGYGGLGGAATRLGAGVGGSVSGAGLGAGVGGLGGAATGGGLGVGAAGHIGAVSGLGGSSSALGGAAAGLGGPSRMSLLTKITRRLGHLQQAEGHTVECTLLGIKVYDSFVGRS